MCWLGLRSVAGIRPYSGAAGPDVVAVWARRQQHLGLIARFPRQCFHKCQRAAAPSQPAQAVPAFAPGQWCGRASVSAPGAQRSGWRHTQLPRLLNGIPSPWRSLWLVHLFVLLVLLFILIWDEPQGKSGLLGVLRERGDCGSGALRPQPVLHGVCQPHLRKDRAQMPRLPCCSYSGYTYIFLNGVHAPSETSWEPNNVCYCTCIYIYILYVCRAAVSKKGRPLFILYCSSRQIFSTSNACFKYSSLVINSFSQLYTSKR